MASCRNYTTELIHSCSSQPNEHTFQSSEEEEEENQNLNEEIRTFQYDGPLTLRLTLMYGVGYLICFLISVGKVNLMLLTMLRGVVFSALSTFFVPIIIHYCCIYRRPAQTMDTLSVSSSE